MVYVNLYGNLGNLLFQYAAALSHGDVAPVGVTSSEKTVAALREYADVFGDLRVVQAAPASARVLRQHKFDFLEIPSSAAEDILLDGYFQSERYFNRERVFPALKPSEARVAALRGRYGDWLGRPNVTGVSVRRGDYLVKADLHPFVGERYFRDCLEKLPEARDFIVCSDDIPWCKSFFPRAFPDRRFLFVENAGVLDQLYVHTLCANNVVSNSSFSWWGAWLANARRRREGLAGRVLAPSMWYGFAFGGQGGDWGGIYFDGMEIVRNGYSPSLWLNARWTRLRNKLARRLGR